MPTGIWDPSSRQVPGLITTPQSLAVAVPGKSSLVGAPGALEFVVQAPIGGSTYVGTGALRTYGRAPNRDELFVYAYNSNTGTVTFSWGGRTDMATKTNGEYLFDVQDIAIPGASGVTAGSLEFHVALYAPLVEGRDVGFSQARATARIVVRALDADDVVVGVSEVVEREGTYNQFTSNPKSVGDITLADVPVIISPPSLNTMAAVLNHKELSNLGSFSTRQIQAHRTFVFTNADEDIANHANAKASISVAKHGSALLEHEPAIEMHHDTDSVMQVSVKGDLTVDGALKYASVVATGGSTFDGGIEVRGADGATIAHKVTAGSLLVTSPSDFDHIDCASLTSTGRIIAFHDIESKADDGTLGNGSNGNIKGKKTAFSSFSIRRVNSRPGPT